MYKKFLILLFVVSSGAYGFEPQEENPFVKLLQNFPVLSIKRNKNAQSYEEIRTMENWKELFPGVPENGPVAWYQVLNVPQTAIPAEIKNAFHKIGRQVHPDKNKAATADATFNLAKAASEATNEAPYTIYYTTPKLAQEDKVYRVEETSLPGLGRRFAKTDQERDAFGRIDRIIPQWKYYFAAQLATAAALRLAYKHSQTKEFKAAHPKIAKAARLISGVSLMGVARFFPNSLTPLGDVLSRISFVQVTQDISDVEPGMTAEEIKRNVKSAPFLESFGAFEDISKPPLGYLDPSDSKQLKAIAGRQMASKLTSGTIGLTGLWMTLTGIRDLIFPEEEDPFLDGEI